MVSKNEIHARVSPDLMESLKRICSEKSCNLSDVTRAALVLYVNTYNCPSLLKSHNLLKSDDSLEISLIEIPLEATQMPPHLVDELAEFLLPSLKTTDTSSEDEIIDW